MSASSSGAGRQPGGSSPYQARSQQNLSREVPISSHPWPSSRPSPPMNSRSTRGSCPASSGDSFMPVRTYQGRSSTDSSYQGHVEFPRPTTQGRIGDSSHQGPVQFPLPTAQGGSADSSYQGRHLFPRPTTQGGISAQGGIGDSSHQGPVQFPLPNARGLFHQPTTQGGIGDSSHLQFPQPTAGVNGRIAADSSYPTGGARGYQPNSEPHYHHGYRQGSELHRPPKSLPPRKFDAVTLLKDKRLGSGSYGVVFMAKCEHVLTCAAKVIHSTLLAGDAEARTPEGRFRQECEMLSSFRHPNVVQYLGTHVGEDQCLMLLMELMDENLTQFLDKSQPQPLPFHTQVHICHDISLALSFLHSNGIIHRDLSSNNVLMIGDRRAKVTDFGMAAYANWGKDRNTSCPGTRVYMPPEALGDDDLSSYKGSGSFDCFSFGVLSLQILTRSFPKLDSMHHMDYPSSHPDGIKVVVPEIQRRRKDIERVDRQHPILLRALECLSDRPASRPSAMQLSTALEVLKETLRYQQSVVNCSGVGSIEQELRSALLAKHEEVDRLRMERGNEEAIVHAMEREIASLKTQLNDARQRNTASAAAKQELDLLRSQVQDQVSASVEMRAQLEKEVEAHRATQQILEDTLQTTTGSGVTSPLSPHVFSSLPAPLTPRSAAALTRRRTWSTSSKTRGIKTVASRERSSLSLDLRDGDGDRPCSGEGIASVTASLKSLAMGDKSVQASVQASYEVTFVPQVRGPHRLSLNIDGEERGAYEVFVEEPIDKLQESPLKVIPCLGVVSRVAVNRKRLYYADQATCKYHIVDLSSGLEAASVQCMREIKGIAVDPDGVVYCTADHQLYKFSAGGEQVARLGSDSPGSDNYSLNEPKGLTLHSQRVHVCDSGNGRVIVFDFNFNIMGTYGEGISGKLKAPRSSRQPSHLQLPVDIAICSSTGTGYVLDQEKRAIVVFTNRVYRATISVDPEQPCPVALCFRDSNLLLVDWAASVLAVYTKSGDLLRTIRLKGIKGSPVGVCTDADGFIYVANRADASSADNAIIVY